MINCFCSIGVSINCSTCKKKHFFQRTTSKAYKRLCLNKLQGIHQKKTHTVVAKYSKIVFINPATSQFRWAALLTIWSFFVCLFTLSVVLCFLSLLSLDICYSYIEQSSSQSLVPESTLKKITLFDWKQVLVIIKFNFILYTDLATCWIDDH